MSLFRCPNAWCLAGDYEADAAGPCPACGHPAPLALVTIHFDPPHRRDPAKRAGVLACNPARVAAGLTAVAETAVVNCPRCKASEPFLKAVEAKNDE